MPTATYLDTDHAVEQWLASIRKSAILALDTEGASFHRFIDRIYLLQLSTRDSHAIIDPLPISAPAALGEIVQDPKVEIVFHDADYDLRLLRQDYGWQIRNVFDTRIAAQLLGLKAFGLAALLERSFGLKLDKKHQRADWSMRPLTADMLDYAAQDTMHLLGLRERLRSSLEQKGRWSWAQEEFNRLEGTQWQAEEDGSSFLRLKGARDLSRRELALLRELVAWRDGVAKGLDRSTFRVVTNDVLLELSRRSPRTMEDLRSIKGIGRGILENRGGEILEAVARGRAVPDADLPRFPKAPRWERDPHFDERVARLKRVRDEAAADLDLDPGVLCARDRLEAVARAKPRHIDEVREIPELRGWQIELLGPAFVKSLRDVPNGESGAAGAVTPAAASGASTPAAKPKAAAGSEAVTGDDEGSPYRDG